MDYLFTIDPALDAHHKKGHNAMFDMTTAATTTTQQTIDPLEARHILGSMPYKYQRPLKRTHVDRLAEAMRRGLFDAGSQLRIAVLDGRKMLVDGQHRLTAVIESGVAQEFVVTTTKVENQHELDQLYAGIDAGRGRSSAERYASLPEKYEISRIELGWLFAAVGLIHTGAKRTMSGGALQTDDQQRLSELYIEPFRRYLRLLKDLPNPMKSPSHRAATVAIALLSYRYSEPHALSRNDPSVTDFWRGVIFDDAIGATDPRKHANRHLLTTAQTTSATSKITITAAYSTRFLATCFNAYMAQRQLKLVKVVDPTGPLVMYGVPSDPADWTC